MKLSPSQLEQYDRDGYLIFPELFTRDEIDVVRADLKRLETVESDAIIRERNGALRTIYRVHEDNGATASPAFRALSRTPRLLEPVHQVLKDDEVYIFHGKCNVKSAIDGTVWLWHQDYGYWQHDGIPTPNMATFLVMLEEATPLNGCLYFIPGSHKMGVQPAERDTTTTSYPQWAVTKDRMIEILSDPRTPKPVPITGTPGTAVIFNCNILHASGHNLGPLDRWHIYFAYNPSVNRPNPVPANPRPEYIVSQNYAPIEMGSDDAILRTLVPA